MKILKLILSILLITLYTPSFFAQCEISISTTATTVGCGDQLGLNALGFYPNSIIATNNFNTGTIGTGWSTTATMLYTNPCGPSLDGTPSIWFGNVDLPRTVTSPAYDLSCGGKISFDLDMAEDDSCGTCSDCEDPDLLNEGVFLSYSIDGGVSWEDIYYFQPDTSLNAPFYQWGNHVFTLPVEAWSASTIFQWEQTSISSSMHDHWGIDNIIITSANCNFSYNWSHTPAVQDSPDQIIYPSDTNMYYVTYSAGSDSCTDSVLINVIPWEIDIIGDTIPLGCGDCSDLKVEFIHGSAGSIEDDFNSGTNSLLWSEIQSGSPSTICSGSATGEALYFDGPGIDRYAQTVNIDATICENIDFSLYMGNTASGGSPCENNELGDDVILEYSIDNGFTFVPITTISQGLWDGNNNQKHFSEIMPLAAKTTSTIFRWRQVAFYAQNGSDNWSLDNVIIGCNSLDVSYNWSTGAVYNSSDPSPTACPSSTDLYTVEVVNSVIGCSANDTLTLYVDSICGCYFMQFDGVITPQPNLYVEINGTFEYSSSPTTGTILIEATNGMGTFSETIYPPFVDSVTHYYTIPWIQNNGSLLTVDISFSDSLNCNKSILLSPNVSLDAIDSYDMQCDFSPNPIHTEGKINFSNETNEEITITIVNTLGELVYTMTTTDQSALIEESWFNNGIYFFEIRSKNSSILCSGNFAVMN